MGPLFTRSKPSRERTEIAISTFASRMKDFKRFVSEARRDNQNCLSLMCSFIDEDTRHGLTGSQDTVSSNSTERFKPLKLLEAIDRKLETTKMRDTLDRKLQYLGTFETDVECAIENSINCAKRTLAETLLDNSKYYEMVSSYLNDEPGSNPNSGLTVTDRNANTVTFISTFLRGLDEDKIRDSIYTIMAGPVAQWSEYGHSKHVQPLAKLVPQITEFKFVGQDDIYADPIYQLTYGWKTDKTQTAGFPHIDRIALSFGKNSYTLITMHQMEQETVAAIVDEFSDRATDDIRRLRLEECRAEDVQSFDQYIGPLTIGAGKNRLNSNVQNMANKFVKHRYDSKTSGLTDIQNYKVKPRLQQGAKTVEMFLGWEYNDKPPSSNKSESIWGINELCHPPRQMSPRQSLANT